MLLTPVMKAVDGSAWAGWAVRGRSARVEGRDAVVPGARVEASVEERDLAA
jgi:undecaprenyl-diphosphatase